MHGDLKNERPLSEWSTHHCSRLKRKIAVGANELGCFPLIVLPNYEFHSMTRNMTKFECVLMKHE